MPPGQEVEQKLLSRKVFDEFLRPSYEDYNLANVPSTILSLFGVPTKRPTIPRKEFAVEENRRRSSSS